MSFRHGRKRKKENKMAEPEKGPEGIPTPDGHPLPLPEVMMEKVKNDLSITIEGAGDGLTLNISVKAPELSKIIRKMTMTNYPRIEYAECFKEILMDHPNDQKKGADGRTLNVVTRKAIQMATKNFVGGTKLNFEEPPPAIMLANPDALEKGYTITFRPEKPIPPDVLKRWGKQFIDGCGDIMSASRPFRFSWVMTETPTYK